MRGGGPQAPPPGGRKALTSRLRGPPGSGQGLGAPPLAGRAGSPWAETLGVVARSFALRGALRRPATKRALGRPASHGPRA